MESLVLEPGMTAQRIAVKNGLIKGNALDFQKQVSAFHESMNNFPVIPVVAIQL